jgi:hypothetical protein
MDPVEPRRDLFLSAPKTLGFTAVKNPKTDVLFNAVGRPHAADLHGLD